MPMAGRVQHALATALTRPSRNASGKAAGPMLAAWSVSVTHFSMSVMPGSYLQPLGPQPADDRTATARARRGDKRLDEFRLGDLAGRGAHPASLDHRQHARHGHLRRDLLIVRRARLQREHADLAAAQLGSIVRAALCICAVGALAAVSPLPGRKTKTPTVSAATVFSSENAAISVSERRAVSARLRGSGASARPSVHRSGQGRKPG